MHDCQTVDPENERPYYNTTSEITTLQWIRLFNFLHRHNLWDQFIAEDAQDKR